MNFDFTPNLSRPRISLIHATYKSRGISRVVRDKWFSLSNNPESIEHCMAFQNDDEEIREEYGIGRAEIGTTSDSLTKFISTTPQISPSAVRNWNAAASISSGEILLGIADDLIPDPGWDDQLWKIVKADPTNLCFWKLDDSRCQNRLDSLDDDVLPRHPAMTRNFYIFQGYFFDPRFVSVGCDDYLLCTGLMNNFIRDGRDLKLHHTIGKVLTSSGELNCGCGKETNLQQRSRSQDIIHDIRWKKLSQTIMKTLPLHWVILSELSGIPEVGTFLLSPRARNKSFSMLFITLLITHKIKLKWKILFLLKFYKRFVFSKNH